MTSRDFAFWLQGYLEVADPTEINGEQVGLIKKHLALVFVHEIDPAMGDDAHLTKLNETHTAPLPPHLRPQKTHDGKPLMRC